MERVGMEDCHLFFRWKVIMIWQWQWKWNGMLTLITMASRFNPQARLELRGCLRKLGFLG
jgi:hypothetical protein